MYRVNYGNGQVSESFKSRREASAFLLTMENRFYSFIEARDNDTGDWFRLRGGAK